MLSIKEFQKFKIYSSHMILGGQEGTSGSGTCNTTCDGETGSADCKSYTYIDNCNGGDRVITYSSTVDGACK